LRTLELLKKAPIFNAKLLLPLLLRPKKKLNLV
jgi:hypothetical protein